ncbi:MAG: hypothetical protein KJ597_04330 [Nanoarchaeota archaeon]|nr:hypothetical protein [Nanoarchaeota archaeon]MBU1622775.1 hypothetical protein [Nanoarchaeota archaeon]
MAQIKITTRCFRCRQEVDRNNVRTYPTLSKEPRYECYDCYRRNKREPLLAGVEAVPLKKEFLCERCNYRFKSKLKMCPLCSKGDYLIGGTITVRDLL